MTDLQLRPGFEATRAQPAGTVATGVASTGTAHLSDLIAAQRHITSDLSLSGTHERIVEVACTVTGVDFGGLVLLGVDGEVVGCAHRGLDESAVEALVALLGPVSTGRGSAAERVAQLGAAGLACTPIDVRGERYGELYLPLGQDSPVQHDPEALKLIALMAGSALESAVLYEQAARSKDWLHASGEIARTLLARQDVDTLLEVVHRALHVAEADSASLLLPMTDGRLRVAVTAGIGEDDYRGSVLDPADSALGRAVQLGESLLVNDMAEIMRPGFDNIHSYGPVMAAPLADARGVRGSVVLCRVVGRLPFSARDLDFATTFADQIALAFDMDDAREQGQWLRVLEDRHDIAQDLHDNVMQRLFATGVGLQSLAAGPLPPDIARRLGRYVADLDETIDEIRTRVFGLRDANGDRFVQGESRFPRVPRGEM